MWIGTTSAIFRNPQSICAGSRAKTPPNRPLNERLFALEQHTARLSPGAISWACAKGQIGRVPVLSLAVAAWDGPPADSNAPGAGPVP